MPLECHLPLAEVHATGHHFSHSPRLCTRMLCHREVRSQGNSGRAPDTGHILWADPVSGVNRGQAVCNWTGPG
jgi:hypothetical protein